MTVSKMSTMSEGKSKNSISWLEDSSVNFEVGRRTREGLNVNSPFVGIKSESREGSLLACDLNLVDEFVSTIESLAWLTF